MERNQVKIVYCRQCRWMYRASWVMQELLTTFEEELTLITLESGTGGVFEVYANEVLVFSRKEKGRHAEITELKQLIRDQIAPEKYLGHSDKGRASAK